MELTKFSPEEEADILHAEQLNILIEFGRETIRVHSQAKDRQVSDALIEHLKKLYFIGYEKRKKEEISKDAERLVELSRGTFKVRWGPRGAELEMDK